MRAAAAALGLVAALALAAAPAAAAPTLVPVGTGYDFPISATASPRDQTRLFVVQRGGLVRVVDLATGTVATDPFIDVSAGLTSEGERGLLSMAFPRDYETSGLAYTYRTGPGGQLEVREHQRSPTDPSRTVPGSRLVWSHPHSATNHNGGQIEFGPDGLLWMAPGDNASSANAQNLGSQLGKMLRIDPRLSGAGQYTVPPDNPYVGQAGRAPEVWAAGLRNPFRFSFDRGTGDLLIGDVGQSSFEEIDHVKRADGLGRGGNFGWPCFEGRQAGPSNCVPVSPYVAPVFDYDRTQGRSVTGGFVARDPGLPTLVGRYLYADYFDGDVKSFDLAAPDATLRDEGLSRPNLSSFGEDACGHLYVVSLVGETVDRIQDGLPGACVLKPDPRSQPPPPPPPPSEPLPVTGSQSGRGVKPVLRVVVSGRRSALARRRLRVAVRSDVAAAVTARARIRRAGAFRAASAQVPAAGRRVLTLRLPRPAARRLRGVLARRGRAVVLLSVVGRDAEGDVATRRPRVTLRRR